MSKLQFALVLICLAHVCSSARIMRDAAAATNAITPEKASNTDADKKDDSSSSSEEFTMEDVNKMKAELISASMPEKDVIILGNIFQKLTPNSTDEQKMDGFMKVMIITFAISQDKSEAEVLKLIESFDSSEVKDKETPKKQ